MTELSTIDRPPITAAEITADLILETADRLGIKLVRGTYFDRYFMVRDKVGLLAERPCGCATGVAAIAMKPELEGCTFIGSSVMTHVFPDFLGDGGGNPTFIGGVEDGFMTDLSVEIPREVSADYLRGFAVGREVARRAGLED